MSETTTFSRQLKYARESYNFSQQNVADYLGICRTTYTKWETGVSEPSFKSIERLVKLFSVDYNFLFIGGNIDEFIYKGNWT